jgi:hypothetical protein
MFNFLYDLYYRYISISQVLSVDRLRSVQLNGNWGRYMFKKAADKEILEPILGLLWYLTCTSLKGLSHEIDFKNFDKNSRTWPN